MRALIPFVLLATPVVAQESHDCVIEPYLVLQVGSAVEGVVEEVHMTRGASVAKGDVLAVLESSVEQKTLDLAEAQAKSDTAVAIAEGRLDLSKRQLDRAREMAERNVGTRADLDIAVAQHRQAELEVLQAREVQSLQKFESDRARAILERRTVKSPIDGILLRRLIGPGEYVYSQAQIAQIATINPLYVDVFLPTALFDSIAVGQMATVVPAEPIGGIYEAEVTAIDQVFDAASDTFGVRLVLPNPDNALPAGVDCKISFPVS